MKSVYVKPVMISERFLPNEYVAACGDTEYGKYKFKCDAGGGQYGGLYNSDWERISTSWDSFHACGYTHESDKDGEYILGYFDPDRNHNNGNEIECYIYLEKDRWGWIKNKHATTNIDREHWETTKS